ncbi:MAG: hypothetical protein QCI82_12290, partial [Candidatus Thermoplasmatota archaeon]|nr:hypothetical protein [Candidatus Thermoplasmatota archaeon]
MTRVGITFWWDFMRLSKRTVTIQMTLILLISLPIVTVAGENEDHFTTFADLSISFDMRSVPFIENKGQWDPSILFVAETSYGKMAIARDGIYHLIVLREMVENNDRYDPFPRPEVIVKDSCLVKVLFEGGSGERVEGVDPVDTRYNFFLGNDP